VRTRLVSVVEGLASITGPVLVGLIEAVAEAEPLTGVEGRETTTPALEQIPSRTVFVAC